MDKYKDVLKQIIKFGIVGGISTVLDYGLMVFFTEVCGIFYIVSSTMSYAISLVFNYFASMKYVFRSKEGIDKIKEFLLFTVLCLLGMGLNQLILWLTVELLGIYYMLAKLVATAVVMVWNFITRKVFLEGRKQS